jgi:hypothetical protein
MDDLVAETTFDVPRLSELLIYLQLKSAVAEQDYKWVIT